ncbi:MAG TPA: tRNA (guanosine(46)-N7)-methyltransferase TrmB [Gammaproteobacteria bacterium]|nr:tRNA (guanosine(46)-N7)-methyltransferase TrmB [Gammaproteobacteria bacterium]
MIASLPDSTPSCRPIRSFVRREGRITPSQQRALARLWPRYGLDAGEQLFDLAEIYGRHATRVLEIGFGDGVSLLRQAQAYPESDYLGIEVHRPGVGRLLRALERAELTNVRVICEDAVTVLRRNIPEQSLDVVQLFFPDPWPKKRHHKRRIVQPEFVELVRTRLREGGRFHLATDWEAYAQHMMVILSEAPGYHNVAGSGSFVSRPDSRPLTKFELRGQRLGHRVWDLIFERC